MTKQARGNGTDDFETDVVSREIIRGKLLAVADEMGLVLMRSSMSPVIYEVLDFACGFCDPDGDLVSQTNGITVFTGTFSIQINVIKQKFGDRIRPGDIFMLNNPYAGGFTTYHYGRPASGVHALQIEINRRLYMDEDEVRPLPGMGRIRDAMTTLIAALCRLPASCFTTREAAE